MLTQNTGVVRSQFVADLAEGDLAIRCVGSLRYFFSVLRYSELILICQQSCLYILCISFGCGQSQLAVCTVGVGEDCFVNRCKLSALICFDDGLLNIQLSFAFVSFFLIILMNGNFRNQLTFTIVSYINRYIVNCRVITITIFVIVYLRYGIMIV